MTGLSLVTKGMLVRKEAPMMFAEGSGDEGFSRDDELVMPTIRINKFIISKSDKPEINENTIKIGSVKIVLE